MPSRYPAPVRAAASERGLRTLVQGLALDVAIAVAVALLAWLPEADVTSSAAWLILAAALVKSVLTAIASYVMRLKLAPHEEELAGDRPEGGPLPPGTHVRTTTALVRDEDERGRVDGNLIAAVAIGAVLAWLVITVLELLIAR